MNIEAITPILMIFCRYAISGVGVWMVSKGFSEADAATFVDQAALIITGGIMSAGPAIYAAIKRPSQKAMDTAKAVDRVVPKDEPVIVQTPAGVPDIIVEPRR